MSKLLSAGMKGRTLLRCIIVGHSGSSGQVLQYVNLRSAETGSGEQTRTTQHANWRVQYVISTVKVNSGHVSSVNKNNQRDAACSLCLYYVLW